MQPIIVQAFAGSRSQLLDGALSLMFDLVNTNDATTMGYESVTSSRARFVTISREGYYMCQFLAFWNSDFVTNYPQIRPMVNLGGVASDLSASLGGEAYDNRQNLIITEQLSADDAIHHALEATAYFNFTAAWWGEDHIGLGIDIEFSSSVTKNFGGIVVATWIGDPMEALTIT